MNKDKETPTFVAEEIPHGRSGSTIKGAGIWQTLVRDFVASGLPSARVQTGDRDFKQVYASLAHAIKVLELRDSIRAVRRNAVEAVYLQRIPHNGNGNGHHDEVPTAEVPADETTAPEELLTTVESGTSSEVEV